MRTLSEEFAGETLFFLIQERDAGGFQLNGTYGEDMLRGVTTALPEQRGDNSALRIIDGTMTTLPSEVTISGTMLFAENGVTFEGTKRKIEFGNKSFDLKRNACVPWGVVFEPDLTKLEHLLPSYC